MGNNYTKTDLAFLNIQYDEPLQDFVNRVTKKHVGEEIDAYNAYKVCQTIINELVSLGYNKDNLKYEQKRFGVVVYYKPFDDKSAMSLLFSYDIHRSKGPTHFGYLGSYTDYSFKNITIDQSAYKNMPISDVFKEAINTSLRYREANDNKLDKFNKNLLKYGISYEDFTKLQSLYDSLSIDQRYELKYGHKRKLY